MISLILAEDENDTREILKNFIPWNSLGIDNLYEVPNGLAAVDLCESIVPDILLTDVRMPKMDGIQLAQYVKERFPECRIIFLSGYSDKEYLKTAIKIGAVNYIEKPVDIEEIKQVIASAVSLCNEYRENKEKENQIQSMLSRSLPLIMQKTAIDIALQKKDNETVSNIRSFWPQKYGADRSYTTFAVKFGNQALIPEEEKENMKSGIINAVLNSPVYEKYDFSVIAGFLDNRYLILHFNRNMLPNGMNMEITRSLFDSISKVCDKSIQITLAAGVPVSSAGELGMSFRSAVQLLKRHFFRKHGSIIYSGEPAKGSYTFIDSGYEEFQESLNKGQSFAALDFLDRLARNISQYQDSDIGYIKNIYCKLYQLLSEIASNRNITIDSLDAEGSYYWHEISTMETIHDITSYLMALVEAFFYKIEKSSLQGRSIHDIITYIESNYSQQTLSIKDIAEYAHYDHYYLCKLFKKNTDKTINEYITHVRLEKAKELLKQRNTKLYDISGIVGYATPSYFAKLFKKYTGFTPSDYRENYLV